MKITKPKKLFETVEPGSNNTSSNETVIPTDELNKQIKLDHEKSDKLKEPVEVDKSESTKVNTSEADIVRHDASEL